MRNYWSENLRPAAQPLSCAATIESRPQRLSVVAGFQKTLQSNSFSRKTLAENVVLLWEKTTHTYILHTTHITNVS